MSHVHKEKKHGHKHPSKKAVKKKDQPNYLTTLKYVIGPIIGILIGVLIGVKFKFSPKVVTGLKSLAAGIVFAAVSTELIPEIADADILKERVWVVLGVVFGLILFISLRSIFDKYDAKKTGEGKVPWEMVIAIAIDFFMDAILIGMAMTVTTGAGGTAGLMIAFALGAEMLITTLAAAGQMKENKVKAIEVWGIGGLLGGIVLVGGLIGNYVGNRFRNTPPYFGLLAFGVAALMWLILEELIVETGRGKIDSRLQATLIFAGFLGILVSGWFGHAH